MGLQPTYCQESHCWTSSLQRPTPNAFWILLPFKKKQNQIVQVANHSVGRVSIPVPAGRGLRVPINLHEASVATDAFLTPVWKPYYIVA